MSTALALLDVNALVDKAMSSGAGLETLERLFQLSKEVRAEQAKSAWYQAMAKFHAEVPEIRKTKTARVRTKDRNGNWSGEYTYNYAPLEEIISVCRPVLAKQGLSATFQIVIHAGAVQAVCIVAHDLGHAVETPFTVPTDPGSRMNAAQQVASASTYARRYAYLAALGLAPEDDDDAAAAGDRDDEVQTVVQQHPHPAPQVGPTAKPTPKPKPTPPAKPVAAPKPPAPPAPPPVKVADLPPVREYQNDDGQPVWRGTLLSRRASPSGTTAGNTLHVFKGQDGKEFMTENNQLAYDVAQNGLRVVVEVVWEPGINAPDVRELVDWKLAAVPA